MIKLQASQGQKFETKVFNEILVGSYCFVQRNQDKKIINNVSWEKVFMGIWNLIILLLLLFMYSPKSEFC